MFTAPHRTTPPAAHRLARPPGVVLFLSVLFSSVLPVTDAAATAVVKDVRLASGPNGTRVVIDVSEPTHSAVFPLDAPHRLVIDLKEARLDPKLASLPPGSGMVKTVRAAPRGKSDLRIVLDLTGAADAQSTLVPPADGAGHRVVIDVTQAGSQTTAKPTAASPIVSTVTTAPAIEPKVVKALPAGADADIVIAIDAGHGGEDPGASGRRGTREKDVTLAIARRLKARIDQEPGMRAVLTRDGDYFLPLRDRINRARKHQAHMFVSVHADAVRDRSVTGSSVYVLSSRGASSEAAKWLADEENAADLIGGVSLHDKGDLASVLLDLSQGASMSASIEAADNILHQLDRIGNVRRKAVQHAGFVVLKSPDIPSILVETAFISNVQEEAKLKDPRHQQRLAEAIHEGVRAYFNANPPPGTLYARLKAQGGLANLSR